jgi:hypothetical protein
MSKPSALGIFESVDRVVTGSCYIGEVITETIERLKANPDNVEDAIKAAIMQIIIDPRAKAIVSMYLIQFRANELFVSTRNLGFNTAMEQAKTEVNDLLSPFPMLALAKRIHSNKEALEIVWTDLMADPDVLESKPGSFTKIADAFRISLSYLEPLDKAA